MNRYRYRTGFSQPVHGFTLIELLVVVAIIAVLLAILLPALETAKKAAQTVVCASNMHTMSQALNQFAVDNRDRFPPMANVWAYPDWEQTGGTYVSWEATAYRNTGGGRFPIYLGYLWLRGRYLPEGIMGAKVLSCPLNKVFTVETLMADRARPIDGMGGQYTSYLYTPGVLDSREAGAARFCTVEQVGVSALLFDQSTRYHEGFNAMRADGVVKFFKFYPPNVQGYYWGQPQEMSFDTALLVYKILPTMW